MRAGHPPTTRCKNRCWDAGKLGILAWEQIENVLSQPEIVFAGLKALEDEGIERDTLQQEVVDTDQRLKELDAEQYELLQNALKKHF